MKETEHITSLIRSFSGITAARICFYDLQDFFRYNDRTLREHTGHRCEFCTNARILNGGLKKCEWSDKKEAVELARSQRAPFLHQCHMGLYELLVPIYQEERFLGLVFVGQCRVPGMASVETVRKSAEKLGGNPDAFCRMYRELPEVPVEILFSMGNIVKLCFESMSEAVSETKTNERTKGAALPLPLYKRVIAFIEQSYRTHITPEKLSDLFFVDQCYLARHFKKNTGRTLTDFIHETRLENAKKLLRNSVLSVRLIALNVGIPDANYFVKLFKKYTSFTPSEYRRKYCEGNTVAKKQT